MSNPPASLPARREAPEPVHPCIRCGRPVVDPAAGLCEECNPLELAQPSATQMHGIAAVGILAFVVLLAVLGRAAQAGSGPFDGTVAAVQPADGGLAVTLVVANRGTAGAATTCQLTPVPADLSGQVEVVQLPRIPPGESVSITTTVTKFGTTPVGFAAACGS